MDFNMTLVIFQLLHQEVHTVSSKACLTRAKIFRGEISMGYTNHSRIPAFAMQEESTPTCRKNSDQGMRSGVR